MDEYEPITGELRELLADVNWAEITGHMRLDHGAILDGDWLDSWHAAVGHACDNVDSVHAQLERDYKTACEVNERQDADYTRLKAERDSMAAALDAAQGEHAFAPESHYMMLPKDADGVPIHVGDVMEGVDKYDSLKKVMGKVITVSFESDGTTEVAIQAWNSDGKSWHRAYLDPNASVYRHHVPDTWERIIMDAVCGGDEDELVARCKALAGDVE